MKNEENIFRMKMRILSKNLKEKEGFNFIDFLFLNLYKFN